MGLTIGITVTRQREEYMSTGRNPHGTATEIEDALYERLEQQFPDGGFGLSVCCGAEMFEFSVSFSRYAHAFTGKGYTLNAMYLALMAYVLEHFSADYGIDVRVWYSG